MKNIVIAGAQSYIGESFKDYMVRWPEEYKVSTLDTKGLKTESSIFRGVDVVFCVAGIAHIKETKKNRHIYFDVNRDLVIDIAKSAKKAGVRQFILLSSMSVYGKETGYIKKNTKPNPINAYGKSKLEADIQIEKLVDENYIFTCLRPPMVYGKGCRGNYQRLRSFALKSPFFPDYQNQRSMIYIYNLCEFVKNCIDLEKGGLFFPQNSSFVNTSEMVKLIAYEHKKKIRMTRIFNWAIRIVPVGVVKKVFGSLTYELVDTVERFDFKESIKQTEG